MRAQNGHQRVRYRQHRDRRVGLHRVEPQLPIDAMQCLADRQSALFEIDVSPRQTQRLAAAQPCGVRAPPVCAAMKRWTSAEATRRAAPMWTHPNSPASKSR